jgi:hypothetical protein
MPVGELRLLDVNRIGIDVVAWQFQVGRMSRNSDVPTRRICTTQHSGEAVGRKELAPL